MSGGAAKTLKEKLSKNTDDECEQQQEQWAVEFNGAFLERNHEVLRKLKMQQEKEDKLRKFRVQFFGTPEQIFSQQFEANGSGIEAYVDRNSAQSKEKIIETFWAQLCVASGLMEEGDGARVKKDSVDWF